MANALNNWGEKNVYPNLYRHCLNTMDQIFGSVDELLSTTAENGFLFLDWTAKYIYYKKTKLFSSYPPLKPSLPMKRRKKNCLGAAKWKKSLVIMEKTKLFHSRKTTNLFFLQIKFAFRKDPPNS